MHPYFKSHYFGEEIKKIFILFIYFAIWFSALAFLSYSILSKDGIPYAPLSLALIKALLCAKFMLLGQAIYPMESKAKKPLIWQILPRSFVYLLVVLLLSAIEFGLDGWIHHKGFINSLANFGNGDPIHLLALSVMYWLIVLPYLTFMSLSSVIGAQEIKKIFLG